MGLKIWYGGDMSQTLMPVYVTLATVYQTHARMKNLSQTVSHWQSTGTKVHVFSSYFEKEIRHMEI